MDHLPLLYLFSPFPAVIGTGWCRWRYAFGKDADHTVWRTFHSADLATNEIPTGDEDRILREFGEHDIEWVRCYLDRFANPNLIGEGYLAACLTEIGIIPDESLIKAAKPHILRARGAAYTFAQRTYRQ